MKELFMKSMAYWRQRFLHTIVWKKLIMATRVRPQAHRFSVKVTTFTGVQVGHLLQGFLMKYMDKVNT